MTPTRYESVGASPLLPSGGESNFVATKTITMTKTASGVIFFFEHEFLEFNESLRETKRKPFMEIHGQFMAIGVKHKLSEITRELSEIIFAFFAAFARDK